MRSLIPWRSSRELGGRAPFDMDEIFRDFETFPSRLFRLSEEFPGVPAVESFVKDGNLVVRADLPGIDPKEVDVSVLGNVLTIKGERKEKKEAKEDDYIRHEISYGSFERRMTLPAGVDADKIQARYDKGVLEVTLPAPKEMTPKKISVKAEEKKA